MLVDTSVLLGQALPLGADVPDGGAVSVGGLEAGVLLADDPAVRASRLRRLTAIVADAPILPVDHAVAARFGELRAAAGRVATNDLWIAATALAHDLVLLTADRRQAACRSCDRAS